METKLRKNFEREGKKVLPREESELSDSNIITPGTEFMDLLSKKLQNYIKRRMTTDSRWSKIKVHCYYVLHWSEMQDSSINYWSEMQDSSINYVLH